MDENKPLFEESTQSVRTKENTTWYTSEERDQKNEILSRLIIWDDAAEENGSMSCEDEPEGYIAFNIYDKLLYDRIFDYFSLERNPSFMDETVETKLFKKSNETEWSFSNGTIRCYHRWFCNKIWKDPGKSGKISFTIDDKDLFKKFKAYALKFEP